MGASKEEGAVGNNDDKPPIIIEFLAPPGMDAAAAIRERTPDGYKFKTMNRKGSTVTATFVSKSKPPLAPEGHAP